MIIISIAAQSASILLREGLEALLVIAALAAFLRRAGGSAQLTSLYTGACVAILASLVAAILFDMFLGGSHDDRLEAVVMAAASGLMLYMSGWIFLRQHPIAWNKMIQRSAARALSTGTSVSLGLIAFLAVFREGAETVLFLHALARSVGGWNISLAVGLIAAFAGLVVFYAAMQWLAVRLPLRPTFLFTSAFLFLMGLRFIGGAVQELQEQVIIPYDSVTVPDWLISLGINPTWEAMGAQFAVAALAVASTLALQWRHATIGAK